MVAVPREPMVPTGTPLTGHIWEPMAPCALVDADIPLCACAGILVSSRTAALPKHVSFTNRDAEWIHYPHLTHYAGGEMAYGSWKNIGDYEKPLRKSQTRHRVPRWPRVFVDVTSAQFSTDIRETA